MLGKLIGIRLLRLGYFRKMLGKRMIVCNFTLEGSIPLIRDCHSVTQVCYLSGHLITQYDWYFMYIVIDDK